MLIYVQYVSYKVCNMQYVIGTMSEETRDHWKENRNNETRRVIVNQKTINYKRSIDDSGKKIR